MVKFVSTHLHMTIQYNRKKVERHHDSVLTSISAFMYEGKVKVKKRLGFNRRVNS